MSSQSKTSVINCHCGSGVTYDGCCGPLISRKQTADSAEKLMRSRFSAYSVGDYQYILDTYHVSTRPNITANSLAQDDASTQWLKLEVLEANNLNDHAHVSFRAFSKNGSSFYCLHEKSRFELVNRHWFYIDGEMLSDTGRYKPGRNTDCLCGSGKKFKRCCA